MSESTTKQIQYRELILDAKRIYSTIDQSAPVYLSWCDDCTEQINLWSYWQGSLTATIMVVGQDWGCPEESTVMENIRAINDGKTDLYQYDKHNPTDCNLVELFASIGIDARKHDERLFFTNFILGYRNKGLTGGLKASWFRECEPLFRRLVEIIDPAIVICLGRNTFHAVMRAMGLRFRIGSYNRLITSDRNPVIIDGRLFFAEAHCGYFGTVNRNRGSDQHGLILQKEDWKRIKAAIERLPGGLPGGDGPDDCR